MIKLEYNSLTYKEEWYEEKMLDREIDHDTRLHDEI